MQGYSVVNGNSETLTDLGDMPSDQARKIAQKCADDRDEPVWLCIGETSEKIEPTEISGDLADIEIEAEVSFYCATGTGVEGGVDADVTLTIGPRTFTGEITVVRAADPASRSWGAWGSPDHWVSGDLLRTLRTLDESVPGLFQRALATIESEVDATECERAL